MPSKWATNTLCVCFSLAALLASWSLFMVQLVQWVPVPE